MICRHGRVDRGMRRGGVWRQEHTAGAQHPEQDMDRRSEGHSASYMPFSTCPGPTSQAAHARLWPSSGQQAYHTATCPRSSGISVCVEATPVTQRAMEIGRAGTERPASRTSNVMGPPDRGASELVIWMISASLRRRPPAQTAQTCRGDPGHGARPTQPCQRQSTGVPIRHSSALGPAWRARHPHDRASAVDDMTHSEARSGPSFGDRLWTT